MISNEHFETATSWNAARSLVTFVPREPRDTAGHQLQSIRIHVRDHKRRELPLDARTLEAHHGAFVVTESRPGDGEAKRRALDVSYGRTQCEGRIAGRTARTYERGPEPPPGDIDGRSPAVVTWHDGPMFYLIASDELPVDILARIAKSLYDKA